MRYLVIIALLAGTTLAHADDGRDPTFTIRALGFAGAGEVRLPAGHYGAAAIDLGLESAYWFEPGVGIGVALSRGVYAPFDPGASDDNLSHWDDQIEAELLLRRAVRRFHHGAMSLQGSAGVGMARVRTMDTTGVIVHDEHVYGEAKELSRVDRMEASLTAAIALRVYWIETSIGAHVQVNGAGDWALGPVVTIGATF